MNNGDITNTLLTGTLHKKPYGLSYHNSAQSISNVAGATNLVCAAVSSSYNMTQYSNIGWTVNTPGFYAISVDLEAVFTAGYVEFRILKNGSILAGDLIAGSQISGTNIRNHSVIRDLYANDNIYCDLEASTSGLSTSITINRYVLAIVMISAF